MKNMGYALQAGMGAVVVPTAIFTSIRSTLSTTYDYWAGLATGDRNRDGTYTEQGKAKLIEEHVPAVVKASAGTITPDQAREILRNDITPVLIDAKADPSQTGKLGFMELFPGFSGIIKWGAIGLGAILLIVALKD